MIDLDVSPDVPAYWCYGLVFLLGVFVAIRQIGSQLAGVAGIWWLGLTNILAILYSVIPVALFWLLDRTGAIKDTSLFAAILVGLGYRNIIAGKNEAIRSTADLSQFWTPFQATADSIVASVRESTNRREREAENVAIAGLAVDDRKFETFKELALAHSLDKEAMDAALAKIPSLSASQTTRTVRETAIRTVYGMMLPVEGFGQLMRDRHLMGSDDILARMRKYIGYGWPQLAIIAAILTVAVVKKDDLKPDYLVWRIGKTNTSAADQHRFREDYVYEVLLKSGSGDKAVELLARLLRDPGLTMDRTEQVLLVLGEAGGAGYQTPDIAKAMIAALYVANIDVRRRSHEALTALAIACKVELVAAPAAWKSTDAVSAPDLESKISQWRSTWAPFTGKPPALTCARTSL